MSHQKLPTMENKKKIEDDDQVCWQHQDDDGLKEEEEEESEEMKIEKFYSLIRNYHDARNRLRLRNTTPPPPPPPPQGHGDDHELLSDNKVNSKKRKKMCGDEDDAGGGGGGNWVPSFEVGDFADEVEFRGSLYSCKNINTSSTASTAEKKPDDGNNESLDLKLTL